MSEIAQKLYGCDYSVSSMAESKARRAKVRKKKSRHRRLKPGAILVMALLIIGIITGVNALSFWWQRVSTVARAKSYTLENLAGLNANQVSALAATKTDIAGVSLLEKIQKGLVLSKNADSDGDGLSDKDEIEIYGTDPAKSSTSGDLYTDKYKIEHGMDPAAYYPYAGNFSFDGNECHEITLHAADANDFAARVTRVREDTDAASHGMKVIREYSVSDYAGYMQIDGSLLAISAGDESIGVVHINDDGSIGAEVPFTMIGNKITLKETFAKTTAKIAVVRTDLKD